MASYQFVIELIPINWVKNHKDNIALLYDNEIYDLSLAWKHFSSDVDLESELLKILPKGKSWNADLKVWGKEEESDIQVWYKKDNTIESITFRLDLRKDYNILILNIISLAKKLNCKLFLPGFRQIVNPEYEILDKMIMKSDAARFVNNPDEYLDQRENR